MPSLVNLVAIFSTLAMTSGQMPSPGAGEEAGGKVCEGHPPRRGGILRQRARSASCWRAFPARKALLSSAVASGSSNPLLSLVEGLSRLMGAALADPFCAL